MGPDPKSTSPAGFEAEVVVLPLFLRRGLGYPRYLFAIAKDELAAHRGQLFSIYSPFRIRGTLAGANELDWTTSEIVSLSNTWSHSIMKKIRSAFSVMAIVSACFLIVITHRFLHEERMVDDCLSGRHGSFDYSAMTCDVNENHVYVPYQVRHPHDRTNALLASACIILFVSRGLYMRAVATNNSDNDKSQGPHPSRTKRG